MREAAVDGVVQRGMRDRGVGDDQQEASTSALLTSSPISIPAWRRGGMGKQHDGRGIARQWRGGGAAMGGETGRCDLGLGVCGVFFFNRTNEAKKTNLKGWWWEVRRKNPVYQTANFPFNSRDIRTVSIHTLKRSNIMIVVQP